MIDNTSLENAASFRYKGGKSKMLGCPNQVKDLGGSQKETFSNFKMQLAYGTGSTGLSNEKTDLSQLC